MKKIFFFVSLCFCTMFFLAPLTAEAAASELDDEDYQAIRAFLCEYNPARNYFDGETGVSHCTAYVFYQDKRDNHYYLKMLPAPSYVSYDSGWYNARIPASNIQGRNNNHYVFLYDEDKNKVNENPVSKGSAIDGTMECAITLCHSSWNIIASNFSLKSKDGTVFFPQTPLPETPLWEAVGKTLDKVQPRLLKQGEVMAGIVILVVSYLLFALFWKRCLQSLLP